jgi:hypothetical protein
MNIVAFFISIYLGYKVVLSNPELFETFDLKHKITDEVHDKVMQSLDPKPSYITKQNISKTSLFGREKYYNNFDATIFDRKENEEYENINITEDLEKKMYDVESNNYKAFKILMGSKSEILFRNTI